ncbi:hypothetical protein ALC57_11703, partial [Trachymyrmex cornetzi]
SFAELILGKLKRLLDSACAYQFNQVQLLQVKVEISVVVQQFRMQLIHQVCRFLDMTVLYGVSNTDPVIQRAQFHRRTYSRLLLKLFGSFLESF